LQQVERDLTQIAAAIDAIVAADKELSESTEILTSIPGIAKITAYAMLIDMPELGYLSEKQAANWPVSLRSRGNLEGGRVRSVSRVAAPV
jgi:transposase